MDRLPGRYNLHRLGWKAFEDLVIEINRTVLGATVTPFRMGADAGRDGFFKGKLAGEYQQIAPDSSTVVIQCKHTSSADDGIKLSDVRDERPKIAKLAKDGDADLFAIFTNRRLGAADEKIIREDFETIDGTKHCRIFGEEWIESHIDGNFRLLRRVPRLFGIGDLSQILSNNVSKQTLLILEEMKPEQAVFVPTPSYRDAVSAMEQHGLVVLVGPPASGKSAIALNLCMVLGAEDENLEVLKIETAEQFTSTWSAEDSKKLFWVEDFFGETTLDDHRTKPWAAAFDKIVASLKAGNKFIFTCRDYILKDAHTHVRKSKLDLLENRSVLVRVNDMNIAERERILYNHVKMGSIGSEQKRSIKALLPMVAALPGFTPELARRIGDKRFHRNLSHDSASLTQFVEKPVEFFADVIHDLGTAEQATIAYLLLSNNSLPDPVCDIPAALRASYNIEVADVRHALETLRGSLTKLTVVGNQRVWQVHHPSMIDAMHRNLKDHGAMLDLFVAAAPIGVVLRDCATRDAEYKLFVPEALYAQLHERVLTADPVDAAQFFSRQGEAFLRYALANRPVELAQIIGTAFDEAGNHLGLRLFVQIRNQLGVNFELGMNAIEQSLDAALWSNACTESIFSEDFKCPIESTVVAERLRLYTSRFQCVIDLFEHRATNVSQEISEAHDVLNHLTGFYAGISKVAKTLFSTSEYEAFESVTSPIFLEAEEAILEHLGKWEGYLEDRSDELRHEVPEPMEARHFGMFSDVDQ